MPLTWPSYTDDDFSGTTGTPLDKALLDAMRDGIEDAIFSELNPTLSPADTTDEVVDARGTFDTLALRLDDIQATAGGGGDTDPSTLAASDNVAKNPDLAGWKLGAALAPDHFTLSGTGAAVARATGLGAGPFSAALTFGSAAALLTQDLISTADYADQEALAGRKVSVTVKVSTAVADQARIVVTDGVTQTESDFHTGSGNPEDLTVTHEISGSATKLSFYFEVAQAGTGTFAGVVATYSDNPSPSWQPPPRSGHRVLSIESTVLAAATLMRYKASPGLLRANGLLIHVIGAGFTASNNNSKTLSFIWGGFTYTIFTGGSSTNNKRWGVDMYIARIGSNSQAVWMATQSVLASGSMLTTQTDTNEQTLGFSSNGTDISQQYMLVELLEPSAGI